MEALMRTLLLTVVGFAIYGVGISQKTGNYVVVIPSVLRPGRPLDVSVQVLGTTQAVEVTTELTPAVQGTTDVITSQTSSIQRQGILSLQVPSSATRGSYTVKVRGSGPISFKNETNVTTQYKTRSIFVQTDKAIYKPGQTVHFRVVTVHSDLLPYTGNVSIQIKDPNKSVIKQWVNVKNESGIISNQLVLSEQPVLGEWTIEATAGMSKDMKKISFSVDEYVLPKFDVSLAMPSFIEPGTMKIVVTVTAKYTYGKEVKGSGDLMLTVYSSYSSTRYRTLRRDFTLEGGKMDITFTRAELISIVGGEKCTTSSCNAYDPKVQEYAQMEILLMGKTLVATSSVMEELTGNSYSTNGTVDIVSSPYKLQVLEVSPNTFKPGLQWMGALKLTMADDTTPSASDLLDYYGQSIPVTVTYTCQSYTPRYERFPVIENQHTVDSAGLVPVTFSPHINATSCDLQARFMAASVNYQLNKFVSKSEEGIQLTVPGLTGSIKVNSNIKFEVQSTDVIQGFYYQMLSKGLIVKQGYVSGNGQMKNEFSVLFDEMLSRKASPNVRIMVWYMTLTNEVIADSLDLTVDGAFSNNVTMTFSTAETSPGSSVSLTVTSQPSSYVALLAVDQSVLLLQGSNDITQSQVLSELKQYDSKTETNDNRWFDWWWPVYSGGSDTKDLFENAGVHVLTDGLIYHNEEMDFFPVMAIAPQGGGALDMARNNGPVLEKGSTDTSSVEDKPLKNPSRVRREFPETWIWAEHKSGTNGTVVIDTQVPDTITSWVASAFAINSQQGLGIATENARITVIKPFFVSLNLPYSMIRGEKIALQATVFNYLQTNLQVTVTLESSTMFQVQHPNAVAPATGEATINIYVPAGDGVTASFWIVPQVLGQVPVSVKARSTAAADQVIRNILVEPEGEAQEHSRNLLINLDKNGNQNFAETMTVEYPSSGVVPGSQRAVFTAIGDIMGPSISGLDNLLKMPYGCGEQNMVKFAPNIYIMKYLEATNQMSADIKDKATRYMESGYQRELTYQRDDASFSAFGNRDKAGSTWLTAFVIRCFNQAKPYITVDQTVIDRAAYWITLQQSRNGAFKEPEHGRVIHSELQGGSAQGLGLTAYVLATLLENQQTISNQTVKVAVSRSIDLALTHVESRISAIQSDPYSLSLVTYALLMADRSTATTALDALNALVTVEGSRKYWTKDQQSQPTSAPEPMPFWRRYRPAPSYDIEMTSYGLLIYTLKAQFTDGIAVAGWLSLQRNSLGGYRSTQDTVVALQALSTFESLVGKHANQNVGVKVNIDGTEHTFDTLTQANNVVLQSYEVSGEVRDVGITASGEGVALVQMTIYYHMTTSENESGIRLTVTSRTTEFGEVVVKTCGRWLSPGASGMVVYQISSLTGYETVTDDILSNYGDLGVKRIEKDDKTLNVYLDELPGDHDLCLDIKSVNIYPVADVKEAVASAFNYYNPSVRDSGSYLPESMKNVVVCATCPDCCRGMEGGIGSLKSCVNRPCKNGGACHEDLGGVYYCTCPQGYRGTDCQIRGEITDGGASRVSAYTITMTTITLLIAFVLTL